MRILAVDPGDQRIGLALSDPSGKLARPLTILEHVQRQKDAARIAELATEHEVELIVVGHPLDAENRPTLQSRKAKRLAAAIRDAAEVPVELWDESGSSLAAQQAQHELGVGREQRQGLIDDLAAAAILQSYLDQQKMDEQQ